VENPSGGAVPVDARYVTIGWLLCISANFSQRPLTTFIPKLAAEHGNAAWVAGTLLFALYICQALGGFRSRRWRHLLYRRRPLIGVQFVAALLMALLWLSPTYSISIIAMALLGLTYGFLYFSCVYYVSNDLHSAHSVGINEAMVGLGTVLGVFVSQAIMRTAGNPVAFYPVTIIAILVLAAFQWLWLNMRSIGTGEATETTAEATSE
jgi:MFS family permease